MQVALKDMLGAKTVLVVDDDQEMAARIAGTLEARGIEVVLADSVERALSELMTDGNDFGLLILDVVLPRTKGELNDMKAMQTHLQEAVSVIRSLQHIVTPTRQDLHELRHARDRRAQLRDQIAAKTVCDGGIQIAEELGRQAKANPGIAHPPCLFLSALKDTDLQTRARDAYPGKSTWLVKTGLEAVLLDHIRELLRPEQ